jgi:hypothetical protein
MEKRQAAKLAGIFRNISSGGIFMVFDGHPRTTISRGALKPARMGP